MTTYVEYSISHGPGTLIEHGVMPASELDATRTNVGSLVIYEPITPERYKEFIQVHDSVRAV